MQTSNRVVSRYEQYGQWLKRNTIVVLMCLMALLTIKCKFMILNGRFAAAIRRQSILLFFFLYRSFSVQHELKLAKRSSTLCVTPHKLTH